LSYTRNALDSRYFIGLSTDRSNISDGEMPTSAARAGD